MVFSQRLYPYRLYVVGHLALFRKRHRCIYELDEAGRLASTLTAICGYLIEGFAPHQMHGRQILFFQLRGHATFSLVKGGPLARDYDFRYVRKPVNATLRCGIVSPI